MFQDNDTLWPYQSCHNSFFESVNRSIKKAWNLFLAWHPGVHAHSSNKLFHAVTITALATYPWWVCPQKRTLWKLDVKDSYKRYLLCMLFLISARCNLRFVNDFYSVFKTGAKLQKSYFLFHKDFFYFYTTTPACGHPFLSKKGKFSSNQKSPNKTLPHFQF